MSSPAEVWRKYKNLGELVWQCTSSKLSLLTTLFRARTVLEGRRSTSLENEGKCEAEPNEKLNDARASYSTLNQVATFLVLSENNGGLYILLTHLYHFEVSNLIACSQSLILRRENSVAKANSVHSTHPVISSEASTYLKRT